MEKDLHKKVIREAEAQTELRAKEHLRLARRLEQLSEEGTRFLSTEMVEQLRQNPEKYKRAQEAGLIPLD